MSAHLSWPLRLEKKELEAGRWIDPAAPFSGSLACPALFLKTLPNEWRLAGAHGLLSGNISWHGKFPTPAVTGEGDIRHASFRPPPPWPEVTALHAHLRFTEAALAIDPLKGEVDSIPLDLRGILTASPTGIGLTLVPGESAIELLNEPPEGARLSSVRVLGAGRREGQALLREALLRGTIWPTAFSLTILKDMASGDDQSLWQTTYLSQSEAVQASTLLLRVIPPEPAAGLELGEKRKKTP